jgi:DNA polymerase III subunit beta
LFSSNALKQASQEGSDHMILHCQRDGLLAACQLVSAAVAARSTRPILSNIKAIAEDDRLILMATDMEFGIRYEIRGVKVEESGEAILPVNRLVSILRESPDSELMIDADDRRSRVSTTVSEFEMPGENPTEFPDVPAFSETAFHEVTAGQLRLMIRRVTFAAAKQDTKYAITGVLWEVDDREIRLVATDTKRLAMVSGPVTLTGTPNATKGQSHLVPTKAMALLERSLNDGDDTQIIRIALRPNEVLFQTERATIYSRLLEGRYPPYRDILPKKVNARIPLPVAGFLSATRQAAIMTDEESKKVTFRFAPGKLVLEAQGGTTGRSKVDLVIDQYDGPAIDINFDPHYVVDMLRILDVTSLLELELVDGMRPALFRSGEDYSYLVMPLS